MHAVPLVASSPECLHTTRRVSSKWSIQSFLCHGIVASWKHEQPSMCSLLVSRRQVLYVPFPNRGMCLVGLFASTHPHQTIVTYPWWMMECVLHLKQWRPSHPMNPSRDHTGMPAASIVERFTHQECVLSWTPGMARHFAQTDDTWATAASGRRGPDAPARS